MLLAIKINLSHRSQGFLNGVKAVLNNSNFIYLKTNNTELEIKGKTRRVVRLIAKGNRYRILLQKRFKLSK